MSLLLTHKAHDQVLKAVFYALFSLSSPKLLSFLYICCITSFSVPVPPRYLPYSHDVPISNCCLNRLTLSPDGSSPCSKLLEAPQPHHNTDSHLPSACVLPGPVLSVLLTFSYLTPHPLQEGRPSAFPFSKTDFERLTDLVKLIYPNRSCVWDRELSRGQWAMPLLRKQNGDFPVPLPGSSCCSLVTFHSNQTGLVTDSLTYYAFCCLLTSSSKSIVNLYCPSGTINKITHTQAIIRLKQETENVSMKLTGENFTYIMI